VSVKERNRMIRGELMQKRGRGDDAFLHE